jgi:hypothetical protein
VGGTSQRLLSSKFLMLLLLTQKLLASLDEHFV